MRSTPSPSSGSRGAAAEQQRREEQPQFVDLARVEERPGEVRPALEQHRADAHRAELVEPRAHARGLVFARRDQHLHAGRFEPVGLGARRRRARRPR